MAAWACGDYISAPAGGPVKPSLSTHDGEIPCVDMGGCRPPNDGELTEMWNLVWHLYQSPNSECWLTASELQGRIDTQKIFFAEQAIYHNADEKWGIYNHPDAQDNPDIIVLSPRVAGSVFENRNVLVHEGFHARGYWSKNEGTNSLYEWQANTHENDCQ